MGTNTVFGIYAVFLYQKYIIIVAISAYLWIVVYSQHDQMKRELKIKLAINKYAWKCLTLEKEFFVIMMEKEEKEACSKDVMSIE